MPPGRLFYAFHSATAFFKKWKLDCFFTVFLAGSWRWWQGAGRVGGRGFLQPVGAGLVTPMGAQAEPCEVGGSVGGLQVERDLGELTGPVLFKLGRSLPGNKHFRPRTVMGPDAGWGVRGWGCQLFSLYAEGKGRLATHISRDGGLLSKTAHTDRTIFFIIKIHYEEQT